VADAQRARTPTCKFSIALPGTAACQCLVQTKRNLVGLKRRVLRRAAAVDCRALPLTKISFAWIWKVPLHAADHRHRQTRPRSQSAVARHPVYLYRSEKDVQELLATAAEFAFAKALQGIGRVAFARKKDVMAITSANADAAAQRFYHAIATHDPA